MPERPHVPPPPRKGLARHPALAPLSREHHQALVRARRLRRAAVPDSGTRRVDPTDAAADFLEFFRAEMDRHFRTEEEVLGPLLERLGYDSSRLLGDHASIRALVDRLGSAGSGEHLATLGTLGAIVEAHVRYEERELFEYLQTWLGAAELEAVARALTERGHDDPACAMPPRA